MKRYAMCVRMYAGEKFPPARFIFQAESNLEAENAGFRWAMYQGMNYRLDIVVRPAHQNEMDMKIHNEILI
jgi:hypothetical protein